MKLPISTRLLIGALIVVSLTWMPFCARRQTQADTGMPVANDAGPWVPSSELLSSFEARPCDASYPANAMLYAFDPAAVSEGTATETLNGFPPGCWLEESASEGCGLRYDRKYVFRCPAVDTGVTEVGK